MAAKVRRRRQGEAAADFPMSRERPSGDFGEAAARC